MTDGQQVITQADFSAGAFPGYEDIPPNGVEDIVDGFLRDDAAVERRGGSTYKAFSAAGQIVSLWDGFLAAGPRTVALNNSLGAGLQALSSGDNAFVTVVTGGGGIEVARCTAVAGSLVVPRFIGLLVYAGSRLNVTYTTGTVSITAGSTAVTGAGTAWSAANAEAGALVTFTTGGKNYALPVGSVTSGTALSLANPAPVTYTGTYTIGPEAGVTVSGSGSVRVSAIFDRLVLAQGNAIYPFLPSDNQNRDSTDYHLLPDGASVIGMEPLGEALYVFTTSGVFAISGLAFDLTDDFGNPQRRVDHLARSLVLWGDAGIASHESALLVPAQDDVYLLAGNEQRPIGGGMRKLYREYVKAGYQPGIAAVHRGHYFLPILSGLTTIDVLVCRLDRGAWTRFAGNVGSSIAFVSRSAYSSTSLSRSSALLSAVGDDLLDCTGVLEPAAAVKNDADGSAHQLKITSRSIMLSETQDHTLRKARIRYELDDAASDNPTFTAEWSRGRPGSSFTALTGSAGEGEDPYAWTLAKAGQQTRMRFTSNNAASKAIIRAMEFHVRQHGRT